MLSYVNDFRHPRLTLVQSTTTVTVYHKLLTFHILLYQLSQSVKVVPDMTNQSIPLAQPSKLFLTWYIVVLSLGSLMSHSFYDYLQDMVNSCDQVLGTS